MEFAKLVFLNRFFIYIAYIIQTIIYYCFGSQKLPNEWTREILNDEQNLTEVRVDELLNEYLKDFKDRSLQEKGWPRCSSAYIVSKMAMNAYTRILAKKYPNFCINAACPGFAN